MSAHTKKAPPRYNIVRNTFTIYQIKKLIGKKLLLICPQVNISTQDKNTAKVIKTKILEELSNAKVESKNLVITASCINGILQVIKNIDVFYAINSISYKELDQFKSKTINVIILQYPSMTKSEIKEFIE